MAFPKVVLKGRFIGGPLFHARKVDDLKPAQYGCTVVLDEGEDVKLAATVVKAIEEKWSGKKPPGLQDWAQRVGDDPEFPSYEKHYINPKAPSVSKDGEPLPRPGTFIKRGGVVQPIDQASGIIYPGCYVAVEVDVYCYDGNAEKRIKPGISTTLNKMLFLKDGDRLSSQTTAEDAFADFESVVGDDIEADIPW